MPAGRAAGQLNAVTEIFAGLGMTQMSALSTGLRLLDERYRCSFFGISSQQVDIPIGKSNAAVRFRLADLGRVRRAMDAKTFRRKPDPERTDRVVRPGLDREGDF